jgi:uncharacterized protein (TIGR02145 family)
MNTRITHHIFNPVHPFIGGNGVQTIFTVTLALAITLTLTACGGSKSAKAAAKSGGGNALVDSRDGKKYKTVNMPDGSVWMAENLNYNINDSVVWVGKNLSYNIDGTKCYDNKEENCAKYGKLYNYEAAMKACPKGWHLPFFEEWLAIVAENGVSVAAKLRAKEGWKDYEDKKVLGQDGKYVIHSRNGTDDYGFAALPGGFWSNASSYSAGMDTVAWWWSATKTDPNNTKKDIIPSDVIAIISGSGFEKAGDHPSGKYVPYFNSTTTGYKSLFSSVRCVQGDKEAAEAKIAKAKAKAEAEARGTFTDSRDKKTYKTIKIGSQTWMAENLNYNAKDSKCYDNKEENCKKYGRLYEWATAMVCTYNENGNCKEAVKEKHTGICPAGWHLPTDTEWGNLGFAIKEPYSIPNNVIDRQDFRRAGKYLKSKSGWDGEDNYGFSALPGGFADVSKGKFDKAGSYGHWWTASFWVGTHAVRDAKGPIYEGLASRQDGLGWVADASVWNGAKKSGLLFSVRCVRD